MEFHRDDVAFLRKQNEDLNAELRRRDHEALMREVSDREARAEAMAQVAERERSERLSAEVEETRRARWSLFLTDPNEARFQELVAAQFSPTWVTENIPESGWPPGDGEALHEYQNGKPSAVTFTEVNLPPLVAEARRRGLPV